MSPRRHVITWFRAVIESDKNAVLVVPVVIPRSKSRTTVSARPLLVKTSSNRAAAPGAGKPNRRQMRDATSLRIHLASGPELATADSLRHISSSPDRWRSAKWLIPNRQMDQS